MAELVVETSVLSGFVINKGIKQLKLQIRNAEQEICPEGNHRARFLRAKEPRQKEKRLCRDQIQLNFVVEHEGKEFLVYRKFCADLTIGGELYSFLESWLQNDIEKFVEDDGLLDFERLVGKEADVTVFHFSDGNHPNPFIRIITIVPPGILVED